ncbi:MAG TPA: glycosyltransferase [Methylocella sp.]|jgi:glycosyltransferase involved in cell wall biosynthesis
MPDGAADPVVSPVLPLNGRTVVIVHPAWHSCGSHQVFVSQARAYRSLGANVISVAIADAPGSVDGSRASQAYLAATGDLDASSRIFAGMPLRKIFNGGFLRAGKQWMHGNYAAIRSEIARLATIPDALASAPRIDLIHCNHFFCMPLAVHLRERHDCPVVLDTHDLQARQYALRNRAGWALPPVARYEDMLAIELDAMRVADILLHLNDEEAATFQKLVPEGRHALLYPAVNPMPAGPGGGDLILVASANAANLLGLVWFLKEVLPLAPCIPVRILGNIDQEIRRRAPSLFKAHAGLFRGRVEAEELRDAYRNAAAILLPATAGHGISIKTIEALSCGAPLIAAPLAFRGLGIDAASLPNVTIAEDAAGFAAALRRAYADRHLPGTSRELAPTRRIYQQRFVFDAYRKSLWALAERLVET